jgi:hypothetical protein
VILTAVDPDTARDDVRAILGDRRFRDDPAPRPFRGPLEWIGDRVSSVGRWIADVIDVVPWFVWLAVGLAAVGAVGVWISRRVQRARAVAGRRSAHGQAPGREDPAALERAADEAERRGELERAVRLRFRAGLLRLGDRGAIAYQPSLTTSEVRRLLGSETFDQLASTFDAIAYGGTEARPRDVANAREQWPAVVHESARR